MRRNLLMRAASGAMAFVMVASAVSLSVSAEEAGEWREEDGNLYWYEGGVRQGYDPDNAAYRGKEIYDPGSDAWYWLDNVDKGKKAVSKDVYQESEAGQWGAAEGEDGKRYGKWVRYDENGHMIKGWSTNENGTYYFDPVFGTMAKGETTVDGIPCIFDEGTGIGLSKQWIERDGAMYWYEGGKRQGYDPNDAAYRGKEIYDPASNAWYWLDNDAYGKKAVSKDVYQESEAGQWGADEGADGKRYGKWVRYDENGHMIKGWSTNENGTYYFDPTYGTMAKGIVTIDGKQYEFDRETGILIREVTGSTDTGSTGDSGETETKPADIKWDISEDGKLTVTGTCGSDGKLPTNLWEKRKDEITSAYINVEGVTSLSRLFFKYSNLEYVDLSDLDTSNVENMFGVFYYCSSLTSVDLSGFNTSKATDMSAMFYQCSSLTSVDLSGFDTSNVKYMYCMFTGCSSLTSLDLSGFDTGNVIKIYSMFYQCSSLTSLDVSGFDTSKVTSMSLMFSDCTNLTSLDVSGFDTGNVTDISFMFCNCNSLTSLDVSNFDTGNVTGMSSLFSDCINLTSLDLSGFDTGNVTKMSSMFYNCPKLSEILVGSGWSMDNVTDSSYMFMGCGTDHVTVKTES